MIRRRDSKQEQDQGPATEEAEAGSARDADDVIDLTDGAPGRHEASTGPAVERAADLYRTIIDTEAKAHPLESLSRWMGAVQDRLRDLPATVRQESESLDSNLREATSSLEARLAELEARLNEARRIDARASELVQRVAAMNESIEARLQALEGRVQHVFGLFGQVAQAVDRESAPHGPSLPSKGSTATAPTERGPIGSQGSSKDEFRA